MRFFYKKYLKRVLDFLIALLGLIILLPLCIIILPVVSISNGGPVFFCQTRPGLNGRMFKLIKIKTMTDKRDSFGKILPDNSRLTNFGRLLRSLSIDELPQLINILRGDMSLVGPRPLLTEYMPLYNAFQERRHEIRPGITGWAQVNGRNKLSWKEKFELDIWYVDNISLILDIKILLMTFSKVLKREGINSGAVVTMGKFTGNCE
jgi:lipopolysaccharide/colanic/teichoic acid biosynthesis glycosyltransferase